MGDYLKGRVALVTGSGMGIGRAIARGLAAEGCKVVTNNRAPWDGVIPVDEAQFSRLTKEQQDWAMREYAKYYGDAAQTAQLIRDAGGEAAACFGDISDFDAAGKLVVFAIEPYGKLDIIVNVASAFGFSAVQDMPKKMWDKVNAVKPTGHFYVIRHAVQHLIDNGWGRILNCASPAWTGGDFRQSEYCAANAGVVGMTWALAEELKQFGITANTFCPGAKTRASVDMEIHNILEGKNATISGTGQLSYDGTAAPETFANFLVWLCGEDAKDVTGQVFMTGGKFIGRYALPSVEGAMFADGDGWTLDEVKAKHATLFEKREGASPFGRKKE
jgi:3-oxoacyl-[acyl-carrier protein] reductase